MILGARVAEAVHLSLRVDCMERMEMEIRMGKTGFGDLGIRFICINFVRQKKFQTFLIIKCI